MINDKLSFWQGYACLPLIFTAPILVRSFTDFIGLEKQHLSHALASIDTSRQIGGVTKF